MSEMLPTHNGCDRDKSFSQAMRASWRHLEAALLNRLKISTNLTHEQDRLKKTICFSKVQTFIVILLFIFCFKLKF